jgi:beta-galactosidase GanA
VAWAFSIDPVDDDGRYDVRWRDDYHVPLMESHWWRDVIGPGAELSSYKVVLMPLMPVVSASLRERLRTFVEAGGCLLLGPMTGYRSEEFTAFTDHEFGGLEPLMGGESSVRFTSHWVEKSVPLKFESEAAEVKGFCEGFAPTTAQVLARYAGGYGDGHAGVLMNRVGKGVVITLGCRSSQATYLKLVSMLANHHAIAPVASGSTSVTVVPLSRDGKSISGYGLVNLSESAQSVTLPVGGVDHLSGEAVSTSVAMAPLQVRLVSTGS